MRLARPITIAVALILCGAQCLHAFAQSAENCERYANANDTDLLQFLRSQEAAAGDFACTLFAIKTLGAHRVTNAAGVLTAYLDLELPMTEGERNGIFHQPRSIARSYPAVEALFLIGKPALPALLVALRANRTAGDRKRTNAIYTIMTIFREDGPAGVTSMRQAADQEIDSDTALSLRNAANEAVQWCLPEDKNKCASAAADTAKSNRR